MTMRSTFGFVEALLPLLLLVVVLLQQPDGIHGIPASNYRRQIDASHPTTNDGGGAAAGAAIQSKFVIGNRKSWGGRGIRGC